MYWKVWLDDGRDPVTSETHRPEEVPLDGVIVVLQHLPDGQHELVTGMDYIFWTGDMWVGGSLSDLDKWLRRDAPLVKRGRWTSRAEFQAALSEANEHRRLVTDGRRSR